MIFADKCLNFTSTYPGVGLFCDCENFANLRVQLYHERFHRVLIIILWRALDCGVQWRPGGQQAAAGPPAPPNLLCAGLSRFVKFHITSFHGTYGGGLQYFNVLVGKIVHNLIF